MPQFTVLDLPAIPGSLPARERARRAVIQAMALTFGGGSWDVSAVVDALLEFTGGGSITSEQAFAVLQSELGKGVSRHQAESVAWLVDLLRIQHHRRRR